MASLFIFEKLNANLQTIARMVAKEVGVHPVAGGLLVQYPSLSVSVIVTWGKRLPTGSGAILRRPSQLWLHCSLPPSVWD